LKKKVGLVSLGCPKNLVDSEAILGMLGGDNYEITNNKDEAEIIIVNTCGFIESAKQESINTILEMAECKKSSCRVLIVAGCMAERYREQIIREIPEVDAVVGTGNYGEIIQVIEKAFSGEKPVLYGKLDGADYSSGTRILTTIGKGYAYLKIAEGCDNCCTYCIIPSLRGRYRSRRIEDLTEEAAKLANQGVKELILVAQDITRYGTDIYGSRKLVELIQKLSLIEGIEWIRLLYSYPEEIDDSLIDEVASNHKVVKYLDMPIQHSKDEILRKMGRRGSSREIKELIKKMRERIPGLVLRTSLIVGFPGEQEEDFQDLCDFVSEVEFDRLGVFTYSREEGTPAAKFKSQVPKRIKEERYRKVMAIQKEIALRKNHERLGKVYRAIVEGVAEDGIFYYGRTYAEAPEIDGVVYFTSREPLNTGEFVDIRVLNVDEYDLIGEVLYESSE